MIKFPSLAGLPVVSALARTRVAGVVLHARRRASHDAVGTLAAGLTYYAFLSVFPLILLALSVLGFVLSGGADRDEWATRLAGTIPGLKPLIATNLQALVDGRAGTGVLGLLGVAWTASAIAGAAQGALGQIFRSAEIGAVRRRLRALGVMALLGLLAILSVSATAIVTGGGAGAGITGVAVRALGAVAGVAIDVAFFAAAYRALTPAPGPPLRAHLPGAILMTVGWSALKYAGSLYAVRVVARATALYGTVGAVFGLLAVLHLATRLFLFGAELSATLEERREAGADAGEHAPGGEPAA